MITNNKIKAMQERAKIDTIYKEGLLDAIFVAEAHWTTYEDNKGACGKHIIDDLKEVANVNNK